MISITDDVRVI